ncbi:hypothetical protein [Streptomyces resistomycificus]|uniref:PH domain-containing protein n=1 Tax=Streptomyces resistomycificus TaxID=67356 RepID=A0A0L8L501_9ACTN|nr:hypothetical protein [Streptomyces resistomycificus]KOG33146.1 hypothetical protein ADK37_24075 [Streptomyces resistomycificus]KUN96379.1 hypothetical protein AQJ84_18465 [Streptomyces resistomycificus]
MADGVGGGIEREYGRRRPVPRSWYVLLGIISLNGLFQLTRASGLPVWVKPALAVLMVVLVVLGLLYQRRGSTSTGAEGVTVRLPVGVRRRAWHDVYDIRVEDNPHRHGLLQPQRLAWLYDTEGRRHFLPHVDDLQLEALGAEVADLRAAVARHRGTDWERRPEVEARIRRRAGRRRAWWRAYVGSLLVFLAMLGVLVVQLATDRTPRPFLLLLCVPLASFAALATLLNLRWESQVPRHLRES